MRPETAVIMPCFEQNNIVIDSDKLSVYRTSDNLSTSTARTASSSARLRQARGSMTAVLLKKRHSPRPNTTWTWHPGKEGRQSEGDAPPVNGRDNRSLDPHDTHSQPCSLGEDIPLTSTPINCSDLGSCTPKLYNIENGHVDMGVNGVDNNLVNGKNSISLYEDVRIMKLSELNKFMKENQMKQNNEKCDFRISFHEFPFIRLKIRKNTDDITPASQLAQRGQWRRQQPRLDVIDFNDVHVRTYKTGPPSERISPDVAKAIRMAKLPPTTRSQTSMRHSSIASDDDRTCNYREIKTTLRSADKPHVRGKKHVHFQQKWIYDDGKYYFSDNPYRCK